VPTNPAQVASNRRHFAAIGVTVPTNPAKPIRILDDGNIGRIADAQQAGAPRIADESATTPPRAPVDPVVVVDSTRWCPPSSGCWSGSAPAWSH